MWYVLNAHAHHLDDIEATLASYRGCGSSPLAEACAIEIPWWDRFAISISLGHLLQFEPGGVEPSPAVRPSIADSAMHICQLLEVFADRGPYSLAWKAAAHSAVPWQPCVTTTFIVFSAL